jgi:hypothetical protein
MNTHLMKECRMGHVKGKGLVGGEVNEKGKGGEYG